VCCHIDIKLFNSLLSLLLFCDATMLDKKCGKPYSKIDMVNPFHGSWLSKGKLNSYSSKAISKVVIIL
jgi:hypothetical protein